MPSTPWPPVGSSLLPLSWGRRQQGERADAGRRRKRGSRRLFFSPFRLGRTVGVRAHATPSFPVSLCVLVNEGEAGSTGFSGRRGGRRCGRRAFIRLLECRWSQHQNIKCIVSPASRTFLTSCHLIPRTLLAVALHEWSCIASCYYFADI